MVVKEGNDGPTYFLLDEVDWADEQKLDKIPPELLEKARKRGGARRKFLAAGEGGFYSQYAEMAPGFEVPLHSHDHDEMIIVLAGGCALLGGGPTLKAHDSMVLKANRAYGFTCGSEGMRFLTIRSAPAQFTLVD
jgi:quercetin dioxygenase-like cupin family protein